ncbi:hypothetical protein BO70DRAFT_379909 [Aspergillus heteromorphus CBS 117.55]|uniref:P-loop containing nucleoside triphosphate hydrolase protein n=1 Tax=Aspergillus heteromorphus CBS 117.55 TaxID=1448321 RepID=A0A317W8C2_9EURO|nr:uncharacterized protein BO70DRAFT_379909 [Aspergillus heteromorphus CBS 117.55]PWY81961.1 hypothetical protein BO70DRAFT_379909 [Aspergillus heteromorphus CBS 117.55]
MENPKLSNERGSHQLVCLITYPRTASNLLVRILALEHQPKFIARSSGAGYCFLASQRYMQFNGELTSKPVSAWTEDEKRKAQQLMQEDFERLNSYVGLARNQQKSLFNKEHLHMMLDPIFKSRQLYGENSAGDEEPWKVRLPHAPTVTSSCLNSCLNHTVLPDEYLQTFWPTFLIRHPALVYPSMYRVLSDVSAQSANIERMLQAAINLGWVRSLYDWYATREESSMCAEENSRGPVILDADDIIARPEVVHRYCEIVGLDPTKLRFTWADIKHEDHPAGERFLSTLRDSSGVDSSKVAGTIDLVRESQRWREEFGETAGGRLMEMVQAAMPDYEYLRSRRLQGRAAR